MGQRTGPLRHILGLGVAVIGRVLVQELLRLAHRGIVGEGGLRRFRCVNAGWCQPLEIHGPLYEATRFWISVDQVGVDDGVGSKRVSTFAALVLQ